MAKTTLNGHEVEFDPRILANPRLDQILAMLAQTGMGYDRYMNAFTALGDSRKNERERMGLLLGSKDGLMSCRIAVWLIQQASGVRNPDGQPLTIDEANENVGVLDFLNLLMAGSKDERPDENPKPPTTDGVRAAAGHRTRPNASKATSDGE